MTESHHCDFNPCDSEGIGSVCITKKQCKMPGRACMGKIKASPRCPDN